jgi:Protein kinase domain.
MSNSLSVKNMGTSGIPGPVEKKKPDIQQDPSLKVEKGSVVPNKNVGALRGKFETLAQKNAQGKVLTEQRDKTEQPSSGTKVSDLAKKFGGVKGEEKHVSTTTGPETPTTNKARSPNTPKDTPVSGKISPSSKDNYLEPDSDEISPSSKDNYLEPDSDESTFPSGYETDSNDTETDTPVFGNSLGTGRQGTVLPDNSSLSKEALTHLDSMREKSRDAIAAAKKEAASATKQAKDHGISPDTASKLLGFTANAETLGIDLLRKNLGALKGLKQLNLGGITRNTPDELVTNRLKKIFSSVSSELLATKLSPADVAVLREIRKVHAECSLPLNLAAVRGEEVGLMSKAMGVQTSTFTALLDKAMANIMADANKALGGSKQNTYERLTNQILYSVKQQLRFSPQMRIACGVLFTGAEAAAKMQVGNALAPLQLNKRKKTALLEKIVKEIHTTLPSSSNVDVDRKAPLGQGAFGAAYAGKYNGEKVILKEIKKDHGDIGYEFLALDSLANNPHLPKALGVMRGMNDDGTPATTGILLEQVTGSTFDKTPALLYEQRPEMALHLIGGAIKGLAAMHEQGVAHMDIKVDNMMYDKISNEAKLIDFGLAATKDRTELTAFSNVYKYAGTDAVSNPGPDNNNRKAYDMYAIGTALADMILGMDVRVESMGKNRGWQSPVSSEKSTAFEKIALEPIADAINVMCAQKPSDRPTMAQLVDIMAGNPVTFAQGNGYGIRTTAQVETLQKVFGPEGMIAAGKQACFDYMGK